MTREKIDALHYGEKIEEGKITVSCARYGYSVYFDGKYIDEARTVRGVMDIITSLTVKIKARDLRTEFEKEFIVLRWDLEWHQVLVLTSTALAGGDSIRDGADGLKLGQKVLTEEEIEQWCLAHDCLKEQLFA